MKRPLMRAIIMRAESFITISISVAANRPLVIFSPCSPSGSGDPGRIPTGTQKLPPVRGAIVWPAPPAAPFPLLGTCTTYARVSGASAAGMRSCSCQVPSVACHEPLSASDSRGNEPC